MSDQMPGCSWSAPDCLLIPARLLIPAQSCSHGTSTASRTPEDGLLPKQAEAQSLPATPFPQT